MKSRVGSCPCCNPRCIHSRLTERLTGRNRERSASGRVDLAAVIALGGHAEVDGCLTGTGTFRPRVLLNTGTAQDVRSGTVEASVVAVVYG
jgi:hypothetical protein